MPLQRHALALAILILSPALARAATFGVNSTIDLPDAAPGDGVCATGPIGGLPPACTLRAAIMEANALGGSEPHTINVPDGVFQLARRGDGGAFAGYNEDERQLRGEGAIGNDLWNDLDIGVSVEILGAGEGATVISGDVTDRVFHVAGARVVRFEALTIRNGHTLQRGAGVFVAAAREAHFVDVTIEDNRGTQYSESDEGLILISNGGGIHSRAADLFLTGCTVRNNFAVTGGGVTVAGGWATIRDTTIEGNEARSPGSGAPDIVGGRPGLGGGIALLSTTASPTFLVMHGSTLNANHAQFGGGLGAWGGFQIVNSTFSDNTASQFGGGAYVQTPIGAMISEFEFVTIAGNTSGGGGGIYHVQVGTSRVQLRRSLIAANTPENCNGMGRPRSSGYNLDDANSCAFASSTDLPNTDPLLGTLRNNGGPTATRALLAMSPAIDRAGMSGWRVDQRGETRPYGRAMDIGAYERGLPRLRVPFPIPDRFEDLFGFSVRLEIRGTSDATLKEIVPAMDGMKLSVEIDKSGKSAVVSAFGFKLDVAALKKQTNDKRPALFYVGGDSLEEGSEFLLITDQRYDATLAGVTKLPFGQK